MSAVVKPRVECVSFDLAGVGGADAEEGRREGRGEGRRLRDRREGGRGKKEDVGGESEGGRSGIHEKYPAYNPPSTPPPTPNELHSCCVSFEIPVYTFA